MNNYALNTNGGLKVLFRDKVFCCHIYKKPYFNEMKKTTQPFLFLLTFFLMACGQPQDGKAISSDQADFRVETISQGLEHPWSLAFLPSGEFLVTERRGTLWRIDADGNKREINGVPDVYHAGQGGLLDVVLDPEFQNKGWVYFSYAATDDNDDDIANTEVARARLNLDQNRLTDTEIIFKAQPKVEGGNHWGSRLLFARDGTLYITLGERFNYEDQAQDPSNHLGALIRIHPDGSVPDDNPFVNDNTKRPEIFSFGHRNPQGMALHPQTGAVWIHEHGPRGGDEINILKKGANYGWPAVTFGISYTYMEISDKTSAPGMQDPILQWTPSIAPSGMAFYTGDKFPQWRGDLFVGALAHKHLRRLELDGNTITDQEELLKERGERIRDVRMGPDGYLYLLTDESNGSLLRLEPYE